jgi:hypothetical protein
MELAEYASLAWESGFTGFWAADHVLAPRTGYPTGFLDPFIALSSVASSVPGASLGTGVLLAPLRPSLLLAKEIVTLSMMCEGRLHLGVGTGWYEEDFELLGLDPRKRGSLLDERLAYLRGFEWKDKFGLPNPGYKLIVGGGSRAQGAEFEAPSELSPSVLRRLKSADGWVSRPLATFEQVLTDQNLIESAMEEQDDFEIIHACFVDVPWSSREDEDMSMSRISAACGTERPVEVMARCVIRGDSEELAMHFERRAKAGCDLLVMNPLVKTLESIALYGEVIQLVQSSLGQAGDGG